MHHVSMILKRGRRSYQDIIHINDNFDSFLCPFVLQRSEDVIHHILKGGGRVAQAKIHGHGFI